MSDLAFQTPAWGLVALVVALPLAAAVLARRRSERVARVLVLEPPARNALAIPVLALAGVAALVGTAAAQPVLVDAGQAAVRDDVELLVVVDVSRSMLAAPAVGAPSRFDRARALARRLRATVPEVSAGVASFSDRALPHLFPTHDARAFATTLDRALAVGRPLPRVGGGLSTSFEPLVAVASRGFFSEEVDRRVAVVFTDGEALPLDPEAFRRALADAPPLELIVVRLGAPGERVFRRSGATEAYRADPRAAVELERLAAAIGATVVPESAPGRAEDALASAVGTGPVRTVRERRSTVALAPLALAGSLVPLAVLVRRRNRA